MQTLRPVTKPNKQRKMLYNAPDHIRRKLLSAHLSSDLRGTHVVKSMPVRTGDTVRIVRGDHKSFEGKISRIDLKKYRIYVEGLTRDKVDGTSIFVPVHPSKVILTRLNLDDKWRRKVLERKQKAQRLPEKPEKPEKKPELEVVQKPLEVAELKAPLEEKPVVAEELQEKKAAKSEKKPRRRAAAKKEAQVEKTEKESKPKTEKKKTPRRKAAKKTDQGEE